MSSSKMNLKLHWYKLSIAVLLQLSHQIMMTHGSYNSFKSRIILQDGAYQNITVAFDPKMDSTMCQNWIENIKDVFNQSDDYLYEATNTRFGSVTIVIPYEWSESNLEAHCNLNPDYNITEAKLFETYELADVKITSSHPIAKARPWTKQYRSCQHGAEAIYIPPDFLSRLDPQLSKGREFLHEWMKFRYGVFEEHGYYNDPKNSPCYVKSGQVFYSNCNNNLPLMQPMINTTGQLTEAQCKLLVEVNSSSLKSQLNLVTPSLMYNPYLRNGYHICTNVTHNGLNPTKQNILCERKSIVEIVFSHSDFQQQQLAELFPKTRSPRTLPTITYVQQRVIEPGFVVIIEDSEHIRQSGKLRHVKQAIAEFLHAIPNRTKVMIYRHNGDVAGVRNPINVTDLESKISLLDLIPDITTEPLSRKRPIPSASAKVNTSRSLEIIFREISGVLQIYKSNKWEFVVFASSPPSDVDEGIAFISSKEYPVSVFTFDNSLEWLKFNGIINTRRLVHLPFCFNNNAICNGHTSSLIVNYLRELVSKSQVQEGRRFFHKVAEANIYGKASFIVRHIDGATNFHLTVPVYDTTTNVHVFRPGTTTECSTNKLLNYDGVVIINCEYMEGLWQVIITGSITTSTTHIIHGFVETAGTDRDLIISTSFDSTFDSEVFPRINRFPVYVSVTNKNEEPVVYANVTLDLSYQSMNYSGNYSIVVLNSTELFDDGEEPDVTKNDGVYSAFIPSFASEPSYHTGMVSVSTSPNSKALKGFENEAALLDPDLMNTKCCGSSILFSDSQTVLTGPSYYSVLTPSFKTGEPFNAADDIIPPSRIQSPIYIHEESGSGEYVFLQFLAPGANYREDVINHYNICCTASETGNIDDKMCARISTSACSPVPYNSTQDCRLSLLSVYSEFFGSERPDNETTEVTLFCGIKGVDDASNAGPISLFLVEIVLNFEELEDIAANLNSQKCKSVADGCLPIDVFWALIGCLGGLMLILFIVVLCWLCSTKNSKKQRQMKSDQAMLQGNGLQKLQHPVPLHNVYINEAYIQDKNGQLRLRLTNDGPLLESLSGSLPTVMNKKSASAADIASQSTDLNSRKYVSWGSRVDLTKDTPIFFSRTSSSQETSPERQGPFVSNPSLSQMPSRNSTTPQESDVQLDLFPPNRQRRSSNQNHYTNPRFPPMSKTPVPTVSSQLQIGNTSPIYASVSRGARKPNVPNRNSKPFPTVSPYHISSGSPGPLQSPISSNHIAFFSQPDSLPPPSVDKNVKPSDRLSNERISVTVRPVIQQQNSAPLPPVRLDHFPSSESEAYSDMSHIINSSAYKLGTTVPAHFQSPPVQAMVGAHRYVQRKNQHPKLEQPIQSQQHTLPRSSLPKQNGVGTRDSIGRPRFHPPPPPRRLSQAKDHQATTTPHLSSLENKNASTEEYYDDDSDDWGNDDDVEYPPAGSSFA